MPAGPRPYGDDYDFYRDAHDSGPGSIAFWSNRFYARLVRRRATRGARVLEVGCGLGNVLRQLESDFETGGLDVSTYALAEARRVLRRTRLAVGTVTDLPYASGSADVVIAKHVLEHLSDPAAALRELARVLRSPGGILLYGTPNAANPLKRLKGKDWIGVRDPTHVSVLDPERWLELTRASGFAVERAFSDGFWDVPYLAYLPRAVELALFAIPAAVQVLAGRPLVPARLGESLIVIARRL